MVVNDVMCHLSQCWLREQIVFKEGNKDIIRDDVENDKNTDQIPTRVFWFVFFLRKNPASFLLSV